MCFGKKMKANKLEKRIAKLISNFEAVDNQLDSQRMFRAKFELDSILNQFNGESLSINEKQLNALEELYGYLHPYLAPQYENNVVKLILNRIKEVALGQNIELTPEERAILQNNISIAKLSSQYETILSNINELTSKQINIIRELDGLRAEQDKAALNRDKAAWKEFDVQIQQQEQELDRVTRAITAENLKLAPINQTRQNYEAHNQDIEAVAILKVCAEMNEQIVAQKELADANLAKDLAARQNEIGKEIAENHSGVQEAMGSITGTLGNSQLSDDDLRFERHCEAMANANAGSRKGKDFEDNSEKK